MPQTFAPQKKQNFEFENRALVEGEAKVPIQTLQAALAGGNTVEIKQALADMKGERGKEAFETVMNLVSAGSKYMEYGNADFQKRNQNMEIREAAVRAAYSIAKNSEDPQMVAKVAEIGSQVINDELAKEGFGSGTANFFANERETAFLDVKKTLIDISSRNLEKYGKVNLPYEDFSEMEKSMRETEPAKRVTAEINKQKTNRWVRKNTEIYGAAASSIVGIYQKAEDPEITGRCKQMIVDVLETSKKGGILDKLSAVAGQTAYGLVGGDPQNKNEKTGFVWDYLKNKDYKKLRESYNNQTKFGFSGVAMKIGVPNVLPLYQAWKKGPEEFKAAIGAIDEDLKKRRKEIAPQDLQEIEERFRMCDMLGLKPIDRN